MCGIFGLVLPPGGVAFDFLRDGLLRLEYRGYDSCGVAVLDEVAGVSCYKSEGSAQSLLASIPSKPVGNIGIAHTRWATHGSPSERNAHPISSNGVYVIHNGVIDNYIELKSELEASGFTFITDTDTEVVAHYIALMMSKGHSPVDASERCFSVLKGRFAIVCMFTGHNFLIGAKKLAPLVVGFGDGITSVTSDVQAASPFLKKFSHLSDGDMVVISNSSVVIYNNGIIVDRLQKEFCPDYAEQFCVNYDSRYEHFMLKEILDQPCTFANTLTKFSIHSLSGLDIDISKLKHIIIVGCGSSYFASSVAKYWFESITKLTIYLEIASEFRCSNRSLAGSLAIFVSQSGETADTIEALKRAKDAGAICLSITNTPESTMENLSDASIRMFAGSEIGVASTKTFTSQLAVFAKLVLYFAHKGGSLNSIDLTRYLMSLENLPSVIESVFCKLDLTNVVDMILKSNKCIVTGRGVFCSIAMEGALKIREVAYISTIGIPAGEMKHGTIALVDETMPVIFILSNVNSALFQRTLSNIREVAARGAQIVCITDDECIDTLLPYAKCIICCAHVLDEFCSPVIFSIPMQLLAYKLSIAKGLNADKPRNLAKSVTVE